MIMSPEELEKEFEKYVEIGNNLPPQAADDMLVAYSYYKQATVGDIDARRPTESSNVVQTFKHDAWRRLEGMPQEEAKRRYIEYIKALEIKQKEEEEG